MALHQGVRRVREVTAEVEKRGRVGVKVCVGASGLVFVDSRQFYPSAHSVIADTLAPRWLEAQLCHGRIFSGE